MALPPAPLTSARGHAKNDSWAAVLGGDVSHPLQLTTGLVINNSVTTSPTFGRWAYASYSLVSIRKNAFWLKQNTIFSLLFLILLFFFVSTSHLPSSYGSFVISFLRFSSSIASFFISFCGHFSRLFLHLAFSSSSPPPFFSLTLLFSPLGFLSFSGLSCSFFRFHFFLVALF